MDKLKTSTYAKIREQKRQEELKNMEKEEYLSYLLNTSYNDPKNRPTKLSLQQKYRRFNVPEFKNGGLVKKTGLAKVHKGERVLSVKQKAKYEKDKKELTKLRQKLKSKSQ